MFFMNKRRIFEIALLITGFALVASISGVRLFGYKHPPGITVKEAPYQSSVYRQSWMYGDVEVTPRATYDIKSRILSFRPYWFFWGRDIETRRYDMCVGWGPMSDTTNIKKVTIRQSGRFCSFSWRDLELSSKEVTNNIANMHLVPATKEIDRQLKNLGIDDIVRLRGYLVDLKAPTWSASTSLTRTDGGDGACENLWVEEVIHE